MDELIIQIPKVVAALMRYDMDEYAQKAQEFVDAMMANLPFIINCYSDPKMADVREDALYWPAQMERIINALESHDRYEAVDVLYNETYPNLMELKGMLEKRGIR